MLRGYAAGCAVLCIWSCGPSQPGEGEPAASSLPPGEVLVTVRGRAITAGDLAAYEARLPPSLVSRLQGEAAVRDLLQGLVDVELMLGEAQASGFDDDPEVKGRLHSHYVEQLSAALLRLEIGSKVQVSEAQIREEYQTNYWNREIWPAHILLPSEDEAWEVVRLLREEGADFATVARKRSVAADADLGGDLHRYFRADDAASVITKSVFGLPVGAVSDPIRTRDGWEINKILVDGEVPLSEVHDKIGRLLHRREFFRLHGRYVEELEAGFAVRYRDDGIMALVRAGAAGALELPAADRQLPLVSYGEPPRTIDAGRAAIALRSSGLPLMTLTDRDGAVAAVRQRLLADSLLVLAAEARGLQEGADFQREMAEFRTKFLVGELRRRAVLSEVAVTDDELRHLYEEDRERFRRPYLADATEILVPTRAEADSLRERLAAGEDMKLLAAKHSTRPGAYHSRGHLHLNDGAPEPLQPLVRATKGAEARKVLGPIEVPDGFSLVRVDQSVLADYRPFEEVRHILHYHLKTRRNEEAFEAYIHDLRRRRADWVEWHDEALRQAGQARQS